MKKVLIWAMKIISAVLSFLIIFFGIQPFFVPNYYDESTNVVKGFSYVEDNSVDVLFMGASQLLCAVDAGKLTDEYGISTYNYAASGQPITITPYYLEEALKTQSPKLVMVEVCRVFAPNTEINEQILAWNYSSTKMSAEKISSANEIIDDKTKAFNYAVSPIFLYHDRWKTIGKKGTLEENDIDYLFNPKKYIDLSSRGFWRRDEAEKVNIAYFSSDNTKKEIPAENKEALLKIADICKKNNIKLVYFKAPVADWTKGDSQSVKEFMDKNNFDFFDLNDKIKEIGLDENYDFYNQGHLNYSGAEKTTDYLSGIVKDHLSK